MKKFGSKSGFTLVGLIVVIAILGILAGIAVPAYSGYIKKANEAANYVAAPLKENVDFETFEKMDIRVGHIKDCQKVKKSKKLLQFTIDDGSGVDRTILSGIAAYYEPEQLIGKDVLFVANFAPRKMMGIESQGMILSAVNFDGTLNVTSVLGNVKPGSQVG